MKKSSLFPLALFLGLFSAGFASAQTIQVNLDKKVIMTDSLCMPRNTSAYSVLAMLPELLQRPGSTLYSNYDIQVEGMSISDVRDAALKQLDISDIEKIEISESPISSYQNKGVGGSINLVLRQHGSQSDRLWGNAGVDVTYPMELSPQLLLGHRSERFMVRGLLISNLYNDDSNSETLTYVGDQFSGASASVTDNTYRSHLARAYMQFMPTENDVIKLNVSEAYKYNKLVTTPDHDEQENSTQERRSNNLKVLLNYKHTFPRASFVAEAQYTYTPGRDEHFMPHVQAYESKTHDHNIAGKLELKSALLPAASRGKLDLGVGSNVNGNIGKQDMTAQSLSFNGAAPLFKQPENNTFFLQPYAFIELKAGKMRMKATGEYQHYQYDILRQGITHSVTSNDFTAKIITEWHFTPRQNLRLILDRKLDRPGSDQLFPERLYNIPVRKYVEGNPDLTPVLSHEVRMDYISDYQWEEHRLHFDASASYNKVDDIIRSVTTGGQNSGSGLLGTTQEYMTYENHGDNRIVSGSLMALYSYKAFAVSLTGNVYHNDLHVGDDCNHYTYYNLSLNPHFTLKDGWHGSLCLTYNSRVKQVGTTLSDCAVSTMTIGRRIGNLFVYCFDNVCLQKYATDTTWGQDDTRTDRHYEMSANAVGVGVKYSF